MRGSGAEEGPGQPGGLCLFDPAGPAIFTLKMGFSIAVFGDSITYGAGDSEFDGWVGRLRKYLNSAPKNIFVYNRGVGGDKTEDLLERFEVECQSIGPDIIIFAIGINDSQYVKTKNNPRVSIEKFEENVKKLIEKTKKFTEKILFVGLTKADETKTMPIPWGKEKYYENDVILQYDSVIRQICQKSNILYIHMFDLLDDKLLPDGLHPNSEGYEKMFNRVRDFLVEKGVLE